jgi:hypothetical protein
MKSKIVYISSALLHFKLSNQAMGRKRSVSVTVYRWDFINATRRLQALPSVALLMLEEDF